MPDLRECPCCGKPGELKITRVPIQPLHGGKTEIVRGWVGCPECELYIQWDHDPRGATEKWNKRFTDPLLAFREPPLAIAGLDPRIPDGHGRLIL